MAIHLRAGSMRDIGTFAQLMNDYHQSLRGENLWDVDELRATLLSPSSDPVSNDRYVEIDGLPVAAIHTHVDDPFAASNLYLAAPPATRRLEHARTLLEAAIRLLRARPAMQRDATVEIAVPAEDPELLAHVESLGFRRTRRVYTLQAPVPQPLLPEWAASFTARTLDNGSGQDVASSFAVLDEAFPTGGGGWRMTYDDYAHMVQRDPTAVLGLSILAEDSRGPVGVAVNFLDTTKSSTGHIVLLGVAARARNRGLGRALLLESFQRFSAQDWTYARLSTYTEREKPNLRLFESVGMSPQFFSEVLIRPLF